MRGIVSAVTSLQFPTAPVFPVAGPWVCLCVCVCVCLCVCVCVCVCECGFMCVYLLALNGPYTDTKRTTVAQNIVLGLTAASTLSRSITHNVTLALPKGYAVGFPILKHSRP